MPPELLTTAELADRLEVRREDILDWVRMGIVPAVRVGNRYYYKVGAVVESVRRYHTERAELAEAVAS